MRTPAIHTGRWAAALARLVATLWPRYLPARILLAAGLAPLAEAALGVGNLSTMTKVIMGLATLIMSTLLELRSRGYLGD